VGSDVVRQATFCELNYCLPLLVASTLSDRAMLELCNTCSTRMRSCNTAELSTHDLRHYCGSRAAHVCVLSASISATCIHRIDTSVATYYHQDTDSVRVQLVDVTAA
jgi:integrase